MKKETLKEDKEGDIEGRRAGERGNGWERRLKERKRIVLISGKSSIDR